MTNVLIIYGSTTGNTEFVAETIHESFKSKEHSVTLSNATDVSADILKNKFDLYLLGCSTWGGDEIELQEDFESFYEDLSGDVSLIGKRFAVFGCGDSSYTFFCGAVDAIEDRISRLGGALVYDSLRVDGDPEVQEINEWIEGVVNARQ